MSLNTLAQKVFATTLALALPNAGCKEKTQEENMNGMVDDIIATHSAEALRGLDRTSTPAGTETRQAARREKTNGALQAKCGKNVSIEPDEMISGTGGATAENWACAEDYINDRDCSALRREGQNRVDTVPDFFRCRNGQNQTVVAPWSFVRLGYFDLDQLRADDCSRVADDYKERIIAIMGRLSCDGLSDGNKPFERLSPGDISGGRVNRRVR